ncbi:hypothetical protein MUN88_02055 [Gracilibacillus caseinilyticus]|uniref:HAAS transmembrane region domain-containing protein n=1 Tax=Gracilibacillus caseinilyticus TaxID=2932256 RepID=A0ABY4EY40_9BACI|nr:hypothetical protein [Gracilibacillus caseinilyticus]UOQ48946.1 hypothetical protein MUN88_02055 [Gracilibacillus caseinilyticus]
MKLSAKSTDFLENLRLYLFSSGKNTNESDEIIEELESHLYEAEKAGKNVDDIISMSPKAFMEQIADEVPFDLLNLLKYVPIIFLGGFSYILLGQVIIGDVSYSIIQLIGYPLILLSFLLITSVLFRMIASRNLTQVTEWLLISLPGILVISFFIGLHYLNDYVHSPVILFGDSAAIVTAILAICILIAIALWSKTWFSIIIPIILFLPEAAVRMTAFPENTKLIITSVLTFVLLYIITVTTTRKKKG